jgi:cytochrome c
MRTGNIIWVLMGLVTVSLFFSAAAIAESQLPEIARKAGCMACHKIQGKIIGPGFAWVSYKYKDDKDNGKKAIVNQIIHGGQGQWIRYVGTIFMPPAMVQLTEEQLNELADFILGLDPIAPPESRWKGEKSKK